MGAASREIENIESPPTMKVMASSVAKSAHWVMNGIHWTRKKTGFGFQGPFSGRRLNRPLP
jgi:hypothetical protein